MWWLATALAAPLDIPLPSPCAQRWDTDGDGVFESVERYHYDADGFLDRLEIDQDANGKPEVIVTFTRDAAGRPLRARHDDDADGRPDRVSDCTKVYCTTNWVPVCNSYMKCFRNELGLIATMTFGTNVVVNDFTCWTRVDDGWRYTDARAPKRSPR